MKRILSAVLCAVLILTSLCITTPALSALIHYESAAGVSADGATVSYDSYLGAVKVETDGTGATVSFSDTLTNSYFAAWLPASYKISSIEVTVDGNTDTLIAGHKFSSVTSGETVVLPAADSAYTVYFYGCADSAETIVAEANGSLNGFDEEYLNLDKYEVERYTKYFWENDIVFNESFFPITEKDGSVKPISLMYDIDRVVSVKNAFLNVEYTYGKDYYVENGKLIITPDTSIYFYEYGQIFTDTQKEPSYREMLNGGYAFCGQQMMFFTGYLNVTYTPANEWGGILPESKGYLLPKTTAKLNTPGDTLKIMSIGDSLAGGANASISNGTLPYADIWRDMVPKALQLRYPDVEIEYDTIAQGGATASLAIEKMKNILAYAPDLVFIEFGTNECMNGESAWADGGYIDTLKAAVSAINTALPDCEIVLVAPIISHPIFFPTDWFYAYADSLYSLEREGLVVADSTSLYQYVMTEKRYIDMTGDHLCHPSDFGTRLFVHTILKALETGSEEGYIAGLSARILNYRYENEFLPEQWSELSALAATASAEIAKATTDDAARALYLEYAAQLDAIPNAEEIAKNATINTEQLKFNYAKTADTIDKANLVNSVVRYDEDTKSLLATVTASRKPSFRLDYSVGEKALNASDYSYAVVTCMDPVSNTSSAVKSTVAFIVDGETLSTSNIDHIKDGKFHSYIIDLASKEGFEGTIDGVKIGVFSSTSTGDALYISSIILCADSESAADTAVEREREANGDAALPVTYLCSDAESTKMLSSGEKCLLGDADGDGQLRAKDLLLIRLSLSVKAIEFAGNADTDGDGEITANDVIMLRRTLAGLEEPVIGSVGGAKIEYNAENEAAKITFAEEKTSVYVDLSASGLTADMFKYVTLCAKTGDRNAMEVTVTVTTENGSATDTILIEAGEFFTADTAKFTSLTGQLVSVEFTFDNVSGDVVYFDSFVLTPTVSASQNAETVRIGAANLI